MCKIWSCYLLRDRIKPDLNMLRYGREEQSVGRTVVEAKYGDTNRWDSNPIIMPYGKGVQKGIMKHMEDFRTRTQCWEDKRCRATGLLRCIE